MHSPCTATLKTVVVGQTLVRLALPQSIYPAGTSRVFSSAATARSDAGVPPTSSVLDTEL